jgi:hypothetical protein
VLRAPAIGQDRRMHNGVQRLDSAVQEFGKAGEVLDSRDRHASGRDVLRSRAGRHNCDTGLVQAHGELC